MRVFYERNKLPEAEYKKASINLIVVGAIVMGLMIQGVWL